MISQEISALCFHGYHKTTPVCAWSISEPRCPQMMHARFTKIKALHHQHFTVFKQIFVIATFTSKLKTYQTPSKSSKVWSVIYRAVVGNLGSVCAFGTERWSELGHGNLVHQKNEPGNTGSCRTLEETRNGLPPTAPEGARPLLTLWFGPRGTGSRRWPPEAGERKPLFLVATLVLICDSSHKERMQKVWSKLILNEHELYPKMNMSVHPKCKFWQRCDKLLFKTKTSVKMVSLVKWLFFSETFIYEFDYTQ